MDRIATEGDRMRLITNHFKLNGQLSDNRRRSDSIGNQALQIHRFKYHNIQKAIKMVLSNHAHSICHAAS